MVVIYYLTRTIYKKCITEIEKQKIFAKSVVFNFIRTNKDVTMCPNPKCNYSVKVQNKLKEIKCKCGFIFCFSCLEESHIPCSCEMVKQWKLFNQTIQKKYGKLVEKNADFIWMKENTKQCPRCKMAIEKNQGCNHMTCNKQVGGCGYEFCWNCLQDFYNHNNNCYEDSRKSNYKKKLIEKEKARNKIIVELMDRFIKYYKGWKNHDNNSNFLKKLKNKVENYKIELTEKKYLFEEEVKFLDEALEVIINCTRLLKYIFIYGFFLCDNANITLFEYNYQFLQTQIDKLLEMIELQKLSTIISVLSQNNFKKMFLDYKDHILSLIKSIQTYKNNLINEIDNSLYDKIDYKRIAKLNDE